MDLLVPRWNTHCGVWLIYVDRVKQFRWSAVIIMTSRANAELTVCEKCVEIDKTIERCERAVVSVGDRVTVERLMAMVKDLQAQKAALHPEE